MGNRNICLYHNFEHTHLNSSQKENNNNYESNDFFIQP